MPTAVVELNTIRWLLEQGGVVVCAGGGGIPVSRGANGELFGVEAVVDKAYTAALLATELGAETLVFISQRDRLAPLLAWCQSPAHPYQPIHAIAEFAAAAEQLGDDLYTKLLAGQQFLDHGGTHVVFCPPDAVSLTPAETDGFVIAQAARAPA
jgi:carbamate kinase